jgi:hypothetical protein
MRRAVIAILSALLALVLVSCSGNGSGSTAATATPNEDKSRAIGENKDKATAMATDKVTTMAQNTDQARAMAENILTAYNSGDYDAFTRDLSSAMKLVIREDRFRGFRDKNLPVTGRFVKLVSVTPTGGESDRHPSYDVQAEFEKRGTVLLTMTLSSDNKKVEGLQFKT